MASTFHVGVINCRVNSGITVTVLLDLTIISDAYSSHLYNVPTVEFAVDMYDVRNFIWVIS